MIRKSTLSELLWPEDPADAQLPVEWAEGVAVQVVGCIWRAYDALRSKHLARVDLSQPLDQLERNLTFLHFTEIQIIWADEKKGFGSLHPAHEIPEFQTRKSAPAKPPAYDLGFVHNENQRWIWPIEAKVLQTPSTLTEYLKDVNNKFIAGIAAPFVGEGGMVGYLLTGIPDVVLNQLATELGQSLLGMSQFAARSHGVSLHTRAAAPDLTLHHMIMKCV